MTNSHKCWANNKQEHHQLGQWIIGIDCKIDEMVWQNLISNLLSYIAIMSVLVEKIRGPSIEGGYQAQSSCKSLSICVKSQEIFSQWELMDATLCLTLSKSRQMMAISSSRALTPALLFIFGSRFKISFAWCSTTSNVKWAFLVKWFFSRLSVRAA